LNIFLLIKTLAYENKMELRINRLKVLSQHDLEEMDKEIEKYKSTNNPVLNETLEELQRKISDSRRFLSSTKKEHKKKEKEIETLQITLEKNNKEYEELISQMSDFETQNDSLQKECSEISSKIDTSREQVDTSREQVEKLSKVKNELKIKLQSMTAHFESVQSKNDEMLRTIRQEIYEYTCKIKQSKQTHFEMYNKFVEDMNAAVVVDTEISEHEKLFASKKELFMRVLCRNMEKYNKMRVRVQNAQRAPENYSRINQKLFKGHGGYCGGHLNFPHFKRCSSKGGFIKQGNTHQGVRCPSVICSCAELDEVIRISGDWFKESCYPLMKDFITDPELSYIIQKIHYEELFNLFTNSNIFDEEMKAFGVFEFLCFVSFIGSNGNCSFLETLTP
jgi:predicted  nucleic acid-binding Zn-ribbon protein